MRPSPDSGPPSAHEIELSLVAVVWNDLKVLPAMLDSFFSQVDRGRAEAILVDNGSSDGTVEYLRGRGDVTVIENGLNAGYPAAMNRGAGIARGRYVMLANPDLVFRPGCFRALLEEIGSSPRIGGVSPAIELPTDPPRLCPLLRGDPGLYYGLCFFSGFMARFKESRLINRHFDFESDRCEADLAWIHGSCGLYRREALASVGGGFDERFFLYFEDADLGRSLRKAGWRLRMARGARVVHMEDQTCKRIAVRSRIFFMESWHKYLRKHRRAPFRAAAFVAVAAALLLQLLVQLAKLPFCRARYLPVIRTYLKVHLSAPFRDLEGERARELAEMKRHWKPIPARAPVQTA